MSGLTKTQWDDSAGACNEAFTATVAEAAHVPAADILNLLVTSNAPTTATAVVALLRKLTTTNSVVVSYDIRVNNASITTDSLMQSLETSVSSGQFDTYLAANSVIYNATSLDNSTSSTVDITSLLFPTNAPTMSPGSGSAAVSSAGLIAGLVIGAFLLIAGGAVYFKKFHMASSGVSKWSEHPANSKIAKDDEHAFGVRANPMFQNEL